MHLPGVLGTWHYDDIHLIVQNPHLDDARNLGAFFTTTRLSSADPAAGMYRPVLMVSLAANRMIFGPAPWSFLAVNVLIHLGVCTMAWFLARDLARWAGSSERRTRAIAAAVACLYAVHPVLVETVSYASARSSSLATLFTFGALFAALHFVVGRKPRVDLVVASGLLFLLGCGAKEIAAMTPFLFVALAPIARASVRRADASTKVSWRRVACVAASLLLLLGIFLWMRHLALPEPAGRGTVKAAVGEDAFRGGRRSVFANLLTQTTVLVRYLGLVLWPATLSIDHAARVVSSPGDVTFLLSFTLLLALTVTFVVRAKHAPLACSGWFFFLFALAPTSTVIPLNVIMNEHRLYLPAFGLFLLLSETLFASRRMRALFAARPAWRNALVATCALVLVSLAARSIVRKPDWFHADTLWRSAIAADGGTPLSFVGLGNHLAGVDDIEGAERAFARAVALDPMNRAALINLAEAKIRRYVRTGSTQPLEDACVLLDAMAERRPGHSLIALKAARAHQYLWIATRAPEQAARSLHFLQELLLRHPDHAIARELLAQYREEQGTSSS